MNNKINESMVYDELGLSPLWVTLSKESKIEKNEFWILTHPEFINVYAGYSKELIDTL